MKTLKYHLILYDAECPMCGVCTQAFTRAGMLSAEGRAAYHEVSEVFCPMVDR